MEVHLDWRKNGRGPEETIAPSSADDETGA